MCVWAHSTITSIATASTASIGATAGHFLLLDRSLDLNLSWNTCHHISCWMCGAVCGAAQRMSTTIDACFQVDLRAEGSAIPITGCDIQQQFICVHDMSSLLCSLGLRCCCATCLPLSVCWMTRHFSTDISSLNVMNPKPRDMPSGFLSTCMRIGSHGMTTAVLARREESRQATLARMLGAKAARGDADMQLTTESSMSPYCEKYSLNSSSPISPCMPMLIEPMLICQHCYPVWNVPEAARAYTYD